MGGLKVMKRQENFRGGGDMSEWKAAVAAKWDSQ